MLRAGGALTSALVAPSILSASELSLKVGSWIPPHTSLKGKISTEVTTQHLSLKDVE